MPKQLRFTSWSFSRYSEYKQCPLKAKLNHLDKIREPKNDAMQRGADIHDAARDYIRGLVKVVPLSLSLVKDELNKLKKLLKRKVLPAIVEEDWAFTADWTQTQWNDWNNCVLRIKLDAAHYEDEETLVVTDWKTGKFREELHEEYLEQLELYALAALVLLPHVEKVLPRLVYTDLGKTHPDPKKPLVFTRKDVPQLKKLWARRTTPMLTDTTFAPRPNDKCKWCFYRASNKAAGGGQCKF